MTENKSIFFLTLSFICIWLILDNIYGKKYIDRFLTAVFPFYNSGVTVTGAVDSLFGVNPNLTDEERKEVAEKHQDTINDYKINVGGHIPADKKPIA